MADQDTSTGTHLISEAELSEWENASADFTIPLRDESNDLPDDDNKATDNSDETDEIDTQDEEIDTSADDEPEVEYVADPGEYVPADYSFEVTVYDEDGNKPKTHKIDSVESWDKLMEDEPNFGSAAALSKAMRLATRMETNLENDYKAWKKQKDDFEETKASDDQRTERLNTWMSEMDYLVQRGDLPKVPAKYQNVEWTGEALKDEGVKAQVDLIKFMEKENRIRIKAGLKPMSSILDAYNAQVLSSKAVAPKNTKVAEGKQRQAAGARIAGGSSVPAGNGAPKGVSVGRGGSLDDLGAGWF